ncbi:MAG: hypothetical protein M3401_00385, partial [Actinomycetota bacterium]|nr:hypothetical protein [Actinomycetota bacterium]
MTYLGPLRLHFHGQFQATVSTVNNSTTNFDNATFQPQFQEQGNQGSWNPGGDADWRLLGCEVTAATLADGSPAGADDPVLSCLVADSDRKVPGKLVDLDPEQQMCSMIFGLEVRVCDARGDTLVIGRFEPVAFTELWPRARSSGSSGDPPLGAFYQSVITDLEWSDAASSSAMLSALREAATDGLLSMKFNVDGYDWTFGSETFGRGRIVGTIGVASADEPRHFVAGRHFLPGAAGSALNNCVAVVDEALGKVLLDLGNAIPTRTPGGPLTDIGTLTLEHGGGTIGEIAYQQTEWYERTAGVVALPADRSLTAEELAAIADAPLSITVDSTTTGTAGAIAEAPGGVYARADQFVFRLDAGDIAPARVFATRFGQPHAGAQIRSRQDPSRLQAGPGDPPVATPASAIDFPADVVTGPDGVAELPITASEPGNPRGFIDGQVYGVRPALTQTLGPGSSYPRTPWNFISLLVHDTFHADDPPTWFGSLQPVFEQYSNLYPVMDRFLDLSSYQSVCENRHLLLLAFGLAIDDPNSMPVTRDLSTSARQAILRWLTDVGADGNPLQGAAPPREAKRPPPAA